MALEPGAVNKLLLIACAPAVVELVEGGMASAVVEGEIGIDMVADAVLGVLAIVKVAVVDGHRPSGRPMMVSEMVALIDVMHMPVVDGNMVSIVKPIKDLMLDFGLKLITSLTVAIKLIAIDHKAGDMPDVIGSVAIVMTLDGSMKISMVGEHMSVVM